MSMTSNLRNWRSKVSLIRAMASPREAMAKQSFLSPREVCSGRSKMSSVELSMGKSKASRMLKRAAARRSFSGTSGD